MDSGKSRPPRNWPPSSRVEWIGTVVAYVVVACIVVGIAYWISPASVWAAIGPVVGLLIGLVLMSTPPARRWLARHRPGQWGDDRPDERWR